MAKIGNRFRQARNVGGPLNVPAVVIVSHSLECDAREGIAWNLSNGWVDSAGVSLHGISDPGETVGGVDTGTQGRHVGSPGNSFTNGGEVTGRAAWTRERWLQPMENKALERQAKALAEMGVAHGFGWGDYRWLSVSEVASRRVDGFCYHYDIGKAFPGSTLHWDPGPGYPADIQMTRIRWYAGVQNQWGLDPGTRPEGLGGPTMGTGGAQGDWFAAAPAWELLALFG